MKTEIKTGINKPFSCLSVLMECLEGNCEIVIAYLHGLWKFSQRLEGTVVEMARDTAMPPPSIEGNYFLGKWAFPTLFSSLAGPYLSSKATIQYVKGKALDMGQG